MEEITIKSSVNAILILSCIMLKNGLRVSEWVYFAIAKYNIILSIVYNYNILLPGLWIK